MRYFKKHIKQITVGIWPISIGWKPFTDTDDPDPEVVSKLVEAMENPEIEYKIAENLIFYYQHVASLPTGTTLYQNSNKAYPIIVRDEWISKPSLTPNGITVSFELQQDRRGVIHYPELAKEFRQALKTLDREIYDNPAYAVESISNMVKALY